MAWTNIDNSLVSVGALPFATTIQALRDNPIAIADGDAGAPRVQTAAINDSAVTTEKLAANERINSVTIIPTLAGMTANAVGVPCLMQSQRTTGSIVTYEPNSTIAGSSLRFASAGSVASATAGAGTWRCLGYMQDGTGVLASDRTTSWVRIS
jgi:hypothetical protein